MRKKRPIHEAIGAGEVAAPVTVAKEAEKLTKKGPQKLTKQLVEEIEPPPAGYVITWDSETRGLGILVTRAGHRSFIWQKKINGRSRRLTIGRFPDLTVHQARRAAQVHQGELAIGKNPVEQRAERRRAESAAGTVRDLVAQAFREPAKGVKAGHFHKRKPETRRGAWHVCNLLVAELGKRRIAEVQRRDIRKIFESIGEQPPAGRGREVLANRFLSVCKTLWSLAVDYDLLTETAPNPTRGIKRYKEESKCGKGFSREEYQRIGEALRAERDPFSTAALRLLALTGCRPQEVLSLRWADVDLTAGRAALNLRDSKTGPRQVALGNAAAEVLRQLPGRHGWVFPGVRGQHLAGLRHLWGRVVDRAGLPAGSRAYDLRHGAATVAAELQVPESISFRLTGHKLREVGHRYRHPVESLWAAADKISEWIRAALAGEEEPGAKVLQMRA